MTVWVGPSEKGGWDYDDEDFEEVAEEETRALVREKAKKVTG